MRACSKIKQAEKRRKFELTQASGFGLFKAQTRANPVIVELTRPILVLGSGNHPRNRQPTHTESVGLRTFTSVTTETAGICSSPLSEFEQFVFKLIAALAPLPSQTSSLNYSMPLDKLHRLRFPLFWR